MKNCDTCGNQYDKCFEISLNGKNYTFDCFECAIHALAPICSHCQCRIIGHGHEAQDKFFCCAHCAKKQGAAQLQDRA